MSNIINSFFCSISLFFFNNIIAFLLFGIIFYSLYYIFIKRLNKISKVLYFIFAILILVAGIVLKLLPSKENLMSPIVIKSFYFGPVELVITIFLFISMLLSKYDEKEYSFNNNKVKLKEKKSTRKKTKTKIEKNKIKSKTKE